MQRIIGSVTEEKRAFMGFIKFLGTNIVRFGGIVFVILGATLILGMIFKWEWTYFPTERATWLVTKVGEPVARIIMGLMMIAVGVVYFIAFSPR